MSDLTCIGVLAHPRRPQTFDLAQQMAAALAQRGLTTWHHLDWQPDDVREDVSAASMVIAIGGDGAMLRAARVCAPYDVPVLGLNTGRLGFLTEIKSMDEWDGTLSRLLAGDYWIESRMMLSCSNWRDGQIVAHGDALNDIVISSSGVTKMVELDAYIDRHWTTTYNADALIIATPTGSTAYALAAGGPILPPDLFNMVVVPAAPHLSMDRPIVLSEGATVQVKPAASNRNSVLLTLDGGVLCELQSDDVLDIRAAPFSSHFVRLRSRNYFYRSLLDRLEPRINRNNLDRPMTLEFGEQTQNHDD